VVDSTAGLDRGRRVVLREGSWQRWWCGQFWGEGAFGSLSGLVGEGALAAAVATVTVGHVGVIDRAVVPKIGVPLRQDAVGVMAVDVGGWTPATPVAHSQAVETKPLRGRICAHHVTWTTPSDDNCRWAVDST
jgi:hypothetical protein